MANEESSFVRGGVLALMLGVLLTLIIVGLIQGISAQLYFGNSTKQALESLQGIDEIELNASEVPVPLSSFSSYDETHGTRLFYMASKFPSVTDSQVVTAPDFKLLRAEARKQLEESPSKTSYWSWQYLLGIFFTVILVPILNGVLATLAGEYVYPGQKSKQFRSKLKRCLFG